MNRSHAAALLITVLALSTVGVAASTLPSAQPADRPDSSFRGGFDEAHSGSGGKGASQSINHLALPDLNVENGVKSDRSQSKSTVGRLVVGVALFLAGTALVLWRLTSDDSQAARESEKETDVSTDEVTSEVAHSKRRNLPPTNEVYRAWNTLGTSLEAHREAQETPTEFAQRAIRAGHPRNAVERLTALFCSVRYGGEPPTADREKRAQNAVEQIQRTNDSNSADSAASLSE
ncbi:DUF4129 domain-containing protein [Halogeometricum borinquense]|uniref:DUF4129 domain-containing protein n=1 Tax=Halogeometricum borinquense TaxID=60847 RepID=A0A6C0UHZ1_9EURY|nr:DUF4129 domain-containing protein [Halogeometricum borinquense]QIB75184.1 DUF4129 domain-containing protein [Halogeometricum borinquense]QIQ75837.1 DUF4129 domain-containing protein [Halogeometricum borinquense]